MKKILLVAFVLCFGFIKAQAQTPLSITVPMGYATGQCDITRSWGNSISVVSSITSDFGAMAADGVNLLYTYVDIYITDEDGSDPSQHLFNSIGTYTNGTPLTSGYTDVSTYYSMTPGHTYNVQYEYYAKYDNGDIEYGECSADIYN